MITKKLTAKIAAAVIMSIIGSVATWYAFQDKVVVTCNSHANVSLDTCFYQRKAWHGMFLNEDNTQIFVGVRNNSNETRELQLSSVVQSLSEPDRSPDTEYINPLKIAPHFEIGWLFSDQLVNGQWRMQTTISTIPDAERLAVERLTFVVHPVQDVYNLLIAIGTISGSSVTATALLLQVHFSRKQFKSLKDEIFLQHSLQREASFQKHSELIASAISSYWNARSGIFASAIKEGMRYFFRKPEEPQEEYAKLAREHLEHGYRDVWTLYGEALDESIKLSSEMNNILKIVSDTVEKDIREKIPSLRSEVDWSSNKVGAYSLNDVVYVIMEETYGRMNGTTTLNAFRIDARQSYIQEDNQAKELRYFELTFSNRAGIASSSREDLNKLSSLIEKYLGELIFKVSAKDFVQNFEKLQGSQKIAQYDAKIESIRNTIRNGNLVNGKCNFCSGLDLSPSYKSGKNK